MVNKVILQGRFVADPELKNAGGFSMTEFTVAWSEKYKEVNYQCFMRCKAWRAQADHICKYFNKGKECVIEGRLLTESWEKDGQKQSRTLCNVEKIHFAGTKSPVTTNSSTNTSVETDTDFMDLPTDDMEELPFL